MFIYLITEYTESWDGEKVIKSFNRRYFANKEEVVAIAKEYYNNSEVEEEIDLDDLQNAIAFIERVDKVETCTIDVEEVYSPAHDLTTLYEYTIDSTGNQIKMEIKGFYHGKPDKVATKEFYGSIKWDYYNY
jgi:hypothetical protein